MLVPLTLALLAASPGLVMFVWYLLTAVVRIYTVFLADLPPMRTLTMKHKQWTRRELLRAAAAGIALPTLIPAHVLGGDGRVGANEQVKVGMIGLGGRSRWIVGEASGVPELRIVAVCDCYPLRCDKFLGPKARPEMDRLHRLPQDDRTRKARRRDGRDNYPCTGMDQRVGHAGRRKRLH